MGFCLRGFMGSFCPSILPLSCCLVAILSPFLHPQYEISLPCFSLYLFPLVLHLPLNVKPSLVKCRLHLYYQFPSTLLPDTKLWAFSICKWKSVISLTFQYGPYTVLPPPPVHTWHVKAFSFWLVQHKNDSVLSFKKMAKCWERCVYVSSTKLKYLLIFTLHIGTIAKLTLLLKWN